MLLAAQLSEAAPSHHRAHNERSLGIKAPHAVRHGVPWVAVHTKRRPEAFKAWLNGRNVTKALLRLDGRPRKTTLSPSDGLRRGSNRLVVRATVRGKVDVDRLTIQVRSQALPAAGRDRKVKPGKRVRLDGTNSLPASQRHRLRYRWRIVHEPRDSKARLRGARTPHPRLLTDVRGAYRLELTVRDPAAEAPRGGARSSASEELPPLAASGDTVEVQATATPPIGVRVETLALGNGGGVKIGEEPYEDTSGPSILVLELSKNSLELKKKKELALSTSSKTLQDEICDPSGVVIVAVPPAISSQFTSTFAGHVSCMPDPLGPPAAEGVSLIRAGSQTMNWNGPMTGYLQQNAVPLSPEVTTYAYWYRYVPAEYISYETTSLAAPANGNTITVGGEGQPLVYSDTQQLPPGISGFHAIAISAWTAEQLDSKAFATTGGTPASEEAGITELANWLASYKAQTNPPARIFLQGIGAPNAKSNPNEKEWARAAQLIGEMGGNSHIFNTIAGGYAFFGGAGMGKGGVSRGVDYSEDAMGKPVLLHGVLSLDPLYHFAPRVTDPGGEMDLRLMPIAYEEPQEWPHPDGSPGEQAAAEWIIKERLKDHPGIHSVEELRHEYWGSAEIPREPTTIRTELECGQVPHEEGFESADFEAVCNELNQELVWVGAVSKLLGAPGLTAFGEMQDVLFNTETLKVDQGISTEIAEELSDYDPGDDSVTAQFLGFLSDFSWVGEELFPVPDGISEIGVFAAAFGLGGEFASLANGESPESFTQDADKVADQFLTNTALTLRQLNKLQAIIVSDYGKLSQVGKLAEAGEPWRWTEQESLQAQNSFVSGSVRWAYRQLLPLKYDAKILAPNSEAGDGENTPPSEYHCINAANENKIFYPLAFPKAPEQSYFDHYSTPKHADAWWIMADSDGDPPSASLAEALQKSPVNLYLPWLFEELGTKTYKVFECE